MALGAHARVRPPGRTCRASVPIFTTVVAHLRRPCYGSKFPGLCTCRTNASA